MKFDVEKSTTIDAPASKVRELIEDFNEISAEINQEQKGTDLPESQRSQIAIRPEVVIYPSGEITDFTLQLICCVESVEDRVIYTIGLNEAGELAVGGKIEQ